MRAYTIERFGREREPVIIIDAFSGDPAALIDKAVTATYAPAGVSYPGLRAPADVSYISKQGKFLSTVLYDVFGFERGVSCESCTYSMVTTPRHKLTPPQRLPHYDDAGPDVLACLHYLKGADTGGTSFYRHRRTGFETVTPERAATYRDGLAADQAAYGDPVADYTWGDTERFEMIGDIEAHPDRMIIYRGRTLHSGSIPPALDLSSAPAMARLTINTFMVRLA